MRYRDKVTIVTGGTKGIGAGCVEVFVREGGAHVVFCARDESEGRAFEDRLNQSMTGAAGVAPGAGAAPGSATFLRADVSKVAEVERLIDFAVERFGRLDCLINNAGWHPPAKAIDDFSVDDMRGLLELNVVSAFAACKRALPHLRRTRGNIINMSSLVAVMGQLHATTYVATKGALTAFSKALAVDEAAHGVRVNSVSPGNIYTPLWQEAIDAAADPQRCRADGDAVQLLGRMGTPEEAGQLCLFIAAQATFTTGVDHLLTGGAELSYGRKSRIS